MVSVSSLLAGAIVNFSLAANGLAISPNFFPPSQTSSEDFLEKRLVQGDKNFVTTSKFDADRSCPTVLDGDALVSWTRYWGQEAYEDVQPSSQCWGPLCSMHKYWNGVTLKLLYTKMPKPKGVYELDFVSLSVALPSKNGDKVIECGIADPICQTSFCPGNLEKRVPSAPPTYVTTSTFNTDRVCPTVWDVDNPMVYFRYWADEATKDVHPDTQCWGPLCSMHKTWHGVEMKLLYTKMPKPKNVYELDFVSLSVTLPYKTGDHEVQCDVADPICQTSIC